MPRRCVVAFWLVLGSSGHLFPTWTTLEVPRAFLDQRGSTPPDGILLAQVNALCESGIM
jgi:hypothetical protein